MSLQAGFRLSEAIDLSIERGRIAGQGEDTDGLFELQGGYDAQGNVRLIRRYTVCHLGPEGVGVPYEYLGQWDGEVVAGRWQELGHPTNGDEFEMWPEKGDSVSVSEILRATEPAGV